MPLSGKWADSKTYTFEEEEMFLKSLMSKNK